MIDGREDGGKRAGDENRGWEGMAGDVRDGVEGNGYYCVSM